MVEIYSVVHDITNISFIEPLVLPNLHEEFNVMNHDSTLRNERYFTCDMVPGDIFLVAGEMFLMTSIKAKT